jgi:hypothetical protein
VHLVGFIVETATAITKTLFSFTQKLPHAATPKVHHQAGMC